MPIPLRIVIIQLMETKLHYQCLENDYFKFNSLSFIPNEIHEQKVVALFTHGYTASKSDNISWAQRLSEGHIPSIIFDLPGHKLGGYYPIKSFEEFTEHAHECFITAYEKLLTQIDFTPEKIILAGHSLGALLSLKALELEQFSDALAIGVGLGISQHKDNHLFESDFYQKTLNIRRQLVDENLDSDLVFPWIKDEKISFQLKGKRIHLITGSDDVVVGNGGMEALSFMLENLGNKVSSHEPKKMPHHEPSSASGHLYHFIKKELEL